MCSRSRELCKLNYCAGAEATPMQFPAKQFLRHVIKVPRPHQVRLLQKVGTNIDDDNI